jgi:hypothetical protein
MAVFPQSDDDQICGAMTCHGQIHRATEVRMGQYTQDQFEEAVRSAWKAGREGKSEEDAQADARKAMGFPGSVPDIETPVAGSLGPRPAGGPGDGRGSSGL